MQNASAVNIQFYEPITQKYTRLVHNKAQLLMFSSWAARTFSALLISGCVKD